MEGIHPSSLNSKSPKKGEGLNPVAESGLDQIIDNGYVESPEHKDAIALSVAFRKKHCSVRFL